MIRLVGRGRQSETVTVVAKQGLEKVLACACGTSIGRLMNGLTPPRLTQGFTRALNPKLEHFIRVNPTDV